MLNREDLASAVAQGILSPDAARALLAHAAQRRQLPPADEEHFRLLTGFNDVFVVIASLLLMAALARLGNALSPLLGAVGVAASAWGLAEFFVRRRRMALPAIVLLLAFVGAVFFFGTQALHLSHSGTVLGSALGSLAAWAHWRRFRVPITVAAGTLAALATAISLLLALWPGLEKVVTLLALLAGMLCFTLAMRWDMQDPERSSRRADVAFWLHLLAAPLLVHPVFALSGILQGQSGLLQALLVLALYAVLALVSLAIDRRALMVSALGYVLYALTQLLQRSGAEVSLSLALVALFLGAALLLMSALWARCRALVLAQLPTHWGAKLPGLH